MLNAVEYLFKISALYTLHSKLYTLNSTLLSYKINAKGFGRTLYDKMSYLVIIVQIYMLFLRFSEEKVNIFVFLIKKRAKLFVLQKKVVPLHRI